MTALFDEVQFPVKIAMGSRGGPRRQSQVVILGSGGERRNSRWLNSRRQWDVAYGLHSDADIDEVITFFEARNAKLIGFRFKDWSDFQSCAPSRPPNPPAVHSAIDQVIGTGTGSSHAYQLIKTYTSGARSWVRNITKPVANTVRVAVNGVETFSFSADTTTGLVTLTATNGASVTAGYEFDVPVRFDTDQVEITMSQPYAGTIHSLPIIELPAS